ncbi:hypothetical protein HRI_005053400 [Hibiscus trionum]|uniref:RRM domain-containing protein n=1 Tax=Hibiscus trionum TaxID=183268 RepID=A0A9W7MUJ8_HIBTR|nr:hypothetical protein HRI_005053400 [Hibiscus trionum]
MEREKRERELWREKRSGGSFGRFDRTKWRSSQSLGGARINRRLGFSVFVDNISKRIHKETLKESLASAGKISDIYVAYNNPKRILNPTTFAFVRFRSEEEGRRAIQENNGRMMDRFKIRMFVASPARTTPRNPKNSKSLGVSKNLYAFKDKRSFKEVLLGLGKTTDADCERNSNKVNEELGSKSSSERLIRVEFADGTQDYSTVAPTTNTIKVKKSEMLWRSKALVGVIKESFNPDLVQEALRSEGLQETVCPWFGLMVVVRFNTVSEKQCCWGMRKQMLDTWFRELELLEGFEGKRKIKIWLKLIDVPLSIWSIDFFEALGRRWGTVIDIDKETRNMSRFDKARMVLEVQKISVIPRSISVIVNGQVNKILLEVKEYEDDVQFLDGGRPAGGDCRGLEEPYFDFGGDDPIMSAWENNENINCDLSVRGGVPSDQVSLAKGTPLRENSARLEEAECSENRLVEIPVIEGGGPGLSGLAEWGNFGPCQQGNDVINGSGQLIDPSVGAASSDSKLIDVQIDFVAEGNGVPLSHPTTSIPHTEAQLPPSGSLARYSRDLRAGSKRCDISMFGPKRLIRKKGGRKQKKNKKNRGNSAENNIALGLSEPEKSPNSAKRREENLATIKVGKCIGYHFQATEEEIINHIETLEEKEEE